MRTYVQCKWNRTRSCCNPIIPDPESCLSWENGQFNVFEGRQAVFWTHINNFCRLNAWLISSSTWVVLRMCVQLILTVLWFFLILTEICCIRNQTDLFDRFKSSLATWETKEIESEEKVPVLSEIVGRLSLSLMPNRFHLLQLCFMNNSDQERHLLYSKMSVHVSSLFNFKFVKDLLCTDRRNFNCVRFLIKQEMKLTSNLANTYCRVASFEIWRLVVGPLT